eukprot:TRINITY_DN15179_c0_g2_i1.p1 TRINITY_DN15179_c0_g2~~TRINITY_DN15179_c0_g2_i1.p1  ORF type:complete len:277 (+),score=99.31 TRINITY_DN15179_c0_g2_i1:441-1271(+)
MTGLVPLPQNFKIEKDSTMKYVVSNLLPQSVREVILSVVFNSGYVAVGFIFLPMPDYFAGLGSLFLGMCVPYHQSTSALNSLQSTAIQKHEEETKWWLTYWIVFYMISNLHDALTFSFSLQHFPFWYHLNLVIIMYLQLPLTQGAPKIYMKFVRSSYELLKPFLDLASFTTQPSILVANSKALAKKLLVKSTSSEKGGINTVRVVEVAKGGGDGGDGGGVGSGGGGGSGSGGGGGGGGGGDSGGVGEGDGGGVGNDGGGGDGGGSGNRGVSGGGCS